MLFYFIISCSEVLPIVHFGPAFHLKIFSIVESNFCIFFFVLMIEWMVLMPPVVEEKAVGVSRLSILHLVVGDGVVEGEIVIEGRVKGSGVEDGGVVRVHGG